MAQEEGSIFEDGDALELLCRDVCCAIKSEMGDSSKLIASLALGESSRELARKLENKRKDSKILCLMERTQRKVFREKVINRPSAWLYERFCCDSALQMMHSTLEGIWFALNGFKGIVFTSILHFKRRQL